MNFIKCYKCKKFIVPEKSHMIIEKSNSERIKVCFNCYFLHCYWILRDKDKDDKNRD